MIWFKFLAHEYMDMYPEPLFKTFSLLEEAREYFGFKDASIICVL